MERTTFKFLSRARQELLDMANDAMKFPKSDVFERGIQVGKWQGLTQAVELMESILADTAEEDSKL